MLHWEGTDSGVMTLDFESIQCMARLRSLHAAPKEGHYRRGYDANYNALLVEGAFTIAHELVHCFVGFLSGDRALRTPPSFLPVGFEQRGSNHGESGRMWELLVLGGCVSLSGLTGKDDELPQLRIWLENNHKEIVVDPEVVEAIVQRRFGFPLRTIGEWERVGKRDRKAASVSRLLNGVKSLIFGPAQPKSRRPPSRPPVGLVEVTKTSQGSGDHASPTPAALRHISCGPPGPPTTTSEAAVGGQRGPEPATREHDTRQATTPAREAPPNPDHPRHDLPRSQGPRITEVTAPRKTPVSAERNARPSAPVAPVARSSNSATSSRNPRASFQSPSTTTTTASPHGSPSSGRGLRCQEGVSAAGVGKGARSTKGRPQTPT
ncbi:uncharacterized protein B0H64DRAFT_389095 [Chaetomium fimeti]|uniref:Uncharacterized protein n=1 Tax=Chaetomium fimeti TaxID=1854472 RepID=A0AAE0HN62_9PEZI|nr:hypothetical protein B0H64DRAFT_389095 [Chaetomium fimeti]